MELDLITELNLHNTSYYGEQKLKVQNTLCNSILIFKNYICCLSAHNFKLKVPNKINFNLIKECVLRKRNINIKIDKIKIILFIKIFLSILIKTSKIKENLFLYQNWKF